MTSSEGNSKSSKAPPERAKGKEEKRPEDVESPQSLLAKLRPRRRVIFFVAFVGFCAWIIAFYEPCKIEAKSRKDCGYSGISPMYCATGSCFTTRGGKLDKKVVKVERKKGEKLGLAVKADSAKGSDLMLVQSIESGAVQLYNSNLSADSPDRIRVGDVIAKVDGTGGKGLGDALGKTSAKTVEIEVQRSRLPSYLQWIRSLGSSAKPGRLETVLTAPGFKRWWKLTSQLGAVGFGSWLLSGYGVASLPGWYFGLSAGVAYKLVRCCHDEAVPGGVPHCYRPVDEEPAVVLQKTWAASKAFANKMVKHWRSFAKDVTAAMTPKAKKDKKDKKDQDKK